jgi:hypothetical protein
MTSIRLNPNIQIPNPKEIQITKCLDQKPPLTFFLSPEGEGRIEGITISVIVILVIIGCLPSTMYLNASLY